MTDAKFTLYSNGPGPNGWKVAFVLKALGLSYTTKYLDFKAGEEKLPEYLALNPNGRIPTLIDNETGFTLWESAAIIMYLVDRYDVDHKISAATADEKAIQLQWLAFQVSGQGPYFGQLAWFKYRHAEKLQSAIDRYHNEALRILSVLESVLSKQPFLLGEKVTVADISFISWNNIAYNAMLTDSDAKTKYPATWAWHQALLALPYVAEVLREKAAL